MTGTAEEVKKEEKRHLDGYAVKSNRYVNKCGSWPPPPMFGEDNPATRPEVARKISEAMKGKKKSEEHKRKLGEAQKGKIASAETKRKMSEAQKGEKNPAKRPEVARKISEALKGIKRSAETRRKMSINNGMKRPEVVKKVLETRRLRS